METATSQLPRIMRLALIGVATAFAWIVLVMLFGLGAGNAHADDADEKGLLGAATTLVDRTASAVTGAVTSTATTVTTGVADVVDSVVTVAPEPVQAPVREVVQTTSTAVSAVTAPVAEVASSGIVGAVTAPVVDLATQMPVVGGVVSAVGLDDAVDDLAGTVDETLGAVAGVVDDAGSSIGRPPVAEGPRLPGAPVLPAIPGPWDETGTAVTAAAALSTNIPGLAADALAGWTAASLRFAALAPYSAALKAITASADAFAPAAAGGAFGSAGGLCLPTSSTGSAGAGPGAWALVALDPLAAHRAWVHRAGPEDEHAPAAPVGPTDVSPD